MTDLAFSNVEVGVLCINCANVWTSARRFDPNSPEVIAREIIWNNKFICIDKKPIYNQHLLDMGLFTGWNLFDREGNFRLDKQLSTSNNGKNGKLLEFLFIQAIPLDWRNKLKEFGIKRTDLVVLNQNLIYVQKLLY